MSTIEDIAADIADLTQLLKSSVRAHSKALLTKEISSLQGKLDLLRPSGEEKTAVTAETENEVAIPTASASTVSVPLSRPNDFFVPIDTFCFDAGGYSGPMVSIYISLDGVGTVKSNVRCEFSKSSFDLRIMNLNGRSYRLVKDNLEHNIDPDKSKFIVKANKVIVKLGKVKGEFSYDSWTQLTSKKKNNEKKASKSSDPNASIMDMMKDLYDSGDDSMKKVIGEAMLKSRSGEKMDPPGLDGDM